MFIEAYKKALNVLAKKPIVLWGLSLLSGLMTILATIFTIPFFIVGTVATYVLTCGMAKVYIDGLHGKEVNSDQLFAGFNKRFLRIAGGMAWRSLWIFIWALIPFAGIIIAIIKSYSYRFVPYILMTKPDVTATQALRLSMEMTKGKKWQMFLADLCFMGGFIVAVWVLALLSAIPIIDTLFSLILAILYLAYILFGGIFQGLYQASFYDEADDTNTVNTSATVIL